MNWEKGACRSPRVSSLRTVSGHCVSVIQLNRTRLHLIAQLPGVEVCRLKVEPPLAYLVNFSSFLLRSPLHYLVSLVKEKAKQNDFYFRNFTASALRKKASSRIFFSKT